MGADQVMGSFFTPPEQQNNHQQEILQSLRAFREEVAAITKEVAGLKKSSEETKNIVNKIEWRFNFADLNPWLDMAATQRSRTYRLREKLFKKLNINDETAACWLTGFVANVKVAHILPDSCKDSILRSLKLPTTFKNDPDANPSNFLILDSAVEDAFDQLQISFIPTDITSPNNLTLCIWDPDCRSTPLFGKAPGSTEVHLATIGEFEGFPLNVPSGVGASRRALSYQALNAYIYHKTRYANRLDIDEPADFSSEYEGKDEVRKKLAAVLRTSIREEVEAAENDDLLSVASLQSNT
jgi:hypothetical protein